MKQAFYLFILALTTACAKERLTIQGNLAGLADGAVYLRVYDGVRVRTVDSTLSTGGRFTFGLPQILPEIIFIQVEDNDLFFIPIVIEQRNLQIRGDVNSPESITVEGSQGNADMQAYRVLVRHNEMKLHTILSHLNNASPTGDQAGYKTLVHKRDSLEGLIEGQRRQFIAEYPASIVSAYLSLTRVTDSTSRGEVIQLLWELDRTDMEDNIYLNRLLKATE